MQRACDTVMRSGFSTRTKDTWFAAFVSDCSAAVGTPNGDSTICRTLSGRPAQDSYGTAFANVGHNFTAIGPLGSDRGGTDILAEFAALTFHGNAAERSGKRVVYRGVCVFSRANLPQEEDNSLRPELGSGG